MRPRLQEEDADVVWCFVSWMGIACLEVLGPSDDVLLRTEETLFRYHVGFIYKGQDTFTLILDIEQREGLP